MDESFSNAAQRLLAQARRLARDIGNPSAGVREILAALLDDAESEAADLLRGVPFQKSVLQSQLPRMAAPLDDDSLDAIPLPPWDEPARSVVRRAQEIAVRFSRLEPTTSREILVAILEEPRELAPLLTGAGLDAARIVREFHRQREPAMIRVTQADLLWHPGSHEQIDIGRILDANANRAREGLRVVEEYARFVLGQSEIAGRLKGVRHELRDLMAHFPAEHLLTARDIDSDVGKGLSTAQEGSRPDLASVATANIKRAQEALRAIEEYGKRLDASSADSARRLRYETYAIERLLFTSRRAHDRLAGASLYWLCDPWACHGSVEWTLREALEGGVHVVQLRDKPSTDRERLDLARRIREWTLERGAIFIVNDRPDIAYLSRADGVHVGQDDLSIRDVRRIVGPDLLVGVSTHDPRQLHAALAAGADYIGVGPVFASHTKSFEFYPGLDFVQFASRTATVPAFAIGGISLSNIDHVIEAGATRIAVGHAICSAEDPRQVSRQFRDRLAPVQVPSSA